MGMARVFAGFARVPRQHVARGTDRPFGVKDWQQRLSVSEMDFLTQVFGHAAHVKCNNDSPPQWVLIEQWRINTQSIAFGERVKPARAS
jgi:hypothetical protein